MIKMNLEERLNRRVEEVLKAKENIEEFTSSVERVRKVIGREMHYPGINMFYKPLKTIDDYLLYFELHPEWQGKIPYDMKHDLDKFARSFYGAFERFLEKTDLNKKERKKVRYMFFERKQNKTKYPNTLEGWKAEYQKHPEWHDRKVCQLQTNPKSVELKGSKFYYTFVRWVRKQTKDKKKRQKLIANVFGLNYDFCYSFETVEEWKKEYQKHPKWHGRSIKDMKRDKDRDATLFINCFEDWADMNSYSKIERYQIMGNLFKTVSKVDRSEYELQDFINEYDEHPEWKGLSPRQMRTGKIFGAGNFYKSLLKYTREETTNEEERIKLMQQVLPNNRGRRKLEAKLL
ncbi:hypothetical protein GOV06_05200 [Candidatus Woesearchaeota archaeon]|nr:hypothetical protein [Candidatus Woesearchaeota archaeon]